MLKYFFAVRWQLFRASAARTSSPTRSIRRTSTSSTRSSRATGTRSWDAIKHLILPAIALGSIPLAIITRITRASVLDVQNEDYVRTARAKGLPPRTVDRRHVLRNALLPVTTIIGLQTGLLLSGAVLTETVFAWPGMGSWLVDAIFNTRLPGAPGRDPVPRDRLRASST